MLYLLGVCIQPKFSSTKQTYIKTMHPRPFEEWIEKGHQQDANLCCAYACPTDERSLVRGGGEYNQGSFVYLAKVRGGWVFAGRLALPLAVAETRPGGTCQTGSL